MTKKIIEHIPIIAGFTVIVGMTKLTLFYHSFSIPIVNYIGFTEVGALIASDILLVVLYYGVIYGTFVLFKDLRFPFRHKLAHLNSFPFISILFVIAGILLIVFRLLEDMYYNKIVIDSLMYFIFFITLIQSRRIKLFLLKNKEFNFFILFASAILITIVLNTANEIKSVMNGKYRGSKIITSDSIYVSTDCRYYIGQTDKYLFLYDITKKVTILPTESIKRLEIKVQEN